MDDYVANEIYERVNRLRGFYAGQFTPDEYEDLIEAGYLRFSYTGVGGFMGLAKLETGPVDPLADAGGARVMASEPRPLAVGDLLRDNRNPEIIASVTRLGETWTGLRIGASEWDCDRDKIHLDNKPRCTGWSRIDGDA